MADIATALRTEMLTLLRGSTVFLTGVEGRILDAEPRGFPCAWVGVTGPPDPTELPIDLYATVHVWHRQSKDEVAALLAEARRLLETAPTIEGASITAWSNDYNEVRRNEDDLAYQGLARFKAQTHPA